jgi:excinuclease UvrABC nuclease subunit
VARWNRKQLDTWAEAQRNAPPSPTEEVCLYRHFDAEGVLLYVGVSLSVIHRLAGHRSRSRWFRQIARITVEWFANRGEALEAERLAIREEKPLYNIMGVE